MSDMKCPFCQQELEKRHAATTDYNSMFITYYCGNPECESTTDLIGCKEFWDILGQLIRTRKALGEANEKLRHCVNMTVEELDELKGNLLIAWNALSHFSKDPIANDALKKITALEQKDVK